jgi:hypothetical protein
MVRGMTKTTRTPEKTRLFLAVLCDTCNVTKACEAIGERRATVYEWRKVDPDFATAWDEARAIGAEALEDEATRRAHDGVDEPVFYKGIETGSVRKYSDTLLIFLLKGAKPEKYKDRIANEHSGALGVAVADVDDEQAADKLAAILSAVAERRANSAEDLA